MTKTLGIRNCLPIYLKGEQVAYKFIAYENKEEFIAAYHGFKEASEKETRDYSDPRPSQVMYFPRKVISLNIIHNVQAISKKERVASDKFLCIYFGGKDKVDNCLLIQDAVVYIIQEGQTVDTIKC